MAKAPTRKNEQVKFFTIHHSAVTPGAKNLAELKTRARAYDIAHSKKSYAIYTGGELGYKWISYHRMIARDGAVLETQRAKYVRYHASDWARGKESHNQWGIAILLDGNFQDEKPTEAMLTSASRIIYKWEKTYKISATVKGHKETAMPSTPTACPGTNMGTSKSGNVKKIIDLVNQMHKNKGLTDKELKEQQPVVEKPKTELELLRERNQKLEADAIDYKRIIAGHDKIVQEWKFKIGKLEEEIVLLNDNIDAYEVELERYKRFASVISLLEKIIPSK